MSTDKKPPARKLTTKQRAWLKAYFETFNATEAARRAGYRCREDDYFTSVGGQNLVKLRDEIEKWLDENGLSDTSLKLKLVSLMNAKETRFFAFEGKITDERKVEAVETQRRTLDMALKVKGLYAPEKHNVEGLVINVKVSDEND